MKKGLNIILLMSGLLMLTACPNPPPAEEPCNFVQNSLNRRVSWARFPVEIYIDDSIFAIDVGTDENGQPRNPNTAIYSLQEAAQFWNDQFDSPVFRVVGVTRKLPEAVLDESGRVIPDSFNGIYVVSPDKFQNTEGQDEQARTSINFRGDFIYEADILIDASERFYFEDQSQSVTNGEVQFKSLMIHELGHVLGLGHVEQAGTDSVMYPKLEYGQMRPAPVVNKDGSPILDNQNNVLLELPDVDQGSLACEYQ